jgi:hypothetical protein
MLHSLDTLIGFVVIMTVVSLLITLVVQMVSAALALRGKNLANALSLTFQTIDPKLGKHAHALAAQILRDPIFSDSLFAPKNRVLVTTVTDPAVAALIEAERDLKRAEDDLAKTPSDPARQTVVSTAQAAVRAAQTKIPVGALPTPITSDASKPWRFLSLRGSMTLATAIRPGEIYRILHEFSDLTPTEATLRGLPAILTNKAADLLRALGMPDQPAEESKQKLQAVAKVADLFATDEQKKAVVDSLANFGATVERATTQSYDRFQRWFGSAQDRAEQWFQVHARGITIFFSIVIGLFLQLDTIDIFRQLDNQPALVAALGKSAPDVIAEGQPIIAPGTRRVDTEQLNKARREGVDSLNRILESAGFDLVPSPFFGRWDRVEKLTLTSDWRDTARKRTPIFFQHLFGMLITAGLLTLGAPFWFNLLKNLMNLRPAVATLVERRPQSSPALPQVPPTPEPRS